MRQLACYFLALSLTTCVLASWIPTREDFLKEFNDELRELELASRRAASEGLDLLGRGSERVGQTDSSREDLEDEDDDVVGGGEAEVPPGVQQEGPSTMSPKQETESTGLSGNPFGNLFPDIFSIFRVSPDKPWWSGPNVCVERESKEDKEDEVPGGDKKKEVDDKKQVDEESDKKDNNGGLLIVGTAQFSSCRYTTTKYICTTVTHKNGKTTTSSVTYQCCQGHKRSKNGPGCVKSETKPVLKTLGEGGSQRFADSWTSFSMGSEIETPNSTLFSPSDEAWSKHEMGQSSNANQVETDKSKESDEKEMKILRTHLVESLIESDDFSNDKILTNADKTTLRLNIFPTRKSYLLTVNCVPITKTDAQTASGVVHTIDGVLAPVKSSIVDILSNEKYSKFLQLLKENDLLDTLKSDRPHTVFAVPNDKLQGIENMKKTCLKKVLGHHIVPYTVCSHAASTGQVSAEDSSGNWVHLSSSTDSSDGKGEKRQVLIDGKVPVTRPDMMALDGVVHEVDSPLKPKSVKSFKEMLKDSNHTKFLELLESQGLVDEIENIEGKAVIFVPKDEALDDEIIAPLIESGDLKNVLRYHIAVDEREECNLKDGLKLNTKLEGREVTIKAHSDILSGLFGPIQTATAQCVPLTKLDGKICNGVLHEVQDLMNPPASSLYEMIRDKEEFKAFMDILNGTKLEEDLKSGYFGYGITILIPTKEALEKMGDGNYETLLKDKSLADQILRMHFLNEEICCSSVRSVGWPFTPTTRTLGGSLIEINRVKSGDRVTFSGVPVKKCDYTASDGVAHLLDGVMLPAGQRRNTEIIYKKPNSEIILTGF